ncbi:hypothetical protein HPP92_010344 [Vanilla planifolia]|uniref:Uncharacterized protein n=1 Tax=Vanilla planifolia TaxID=51239 RepID=A0A835R5F1_VANPL|nr:hypothetical protein HPP92_010555 [Vanilla planifolia]KAG0482260.1 hypothetical protein HPP92_010344 [Vanilla planifolia]
MDVADIAEGSFFMRPRGADSCLHHPPPPLLLKPRKTTAMPSASQTTFPTRLLLHH